MTAGEEPGSQTLLGQEFELEVGAVAHGGHFVARYEGRVVFVRHALPGERVRARITEGGAGSRFLRADAVEVLTPSADRVSPRCPHARPQGCGGCDFQHVALPAQRALKSVVVAEQLRRLAGIEQDVVVEEVPAGPDPSGPAGGEGQGGAGLGWRTRVRFAVDVAGQPGLRRYRSHEVVPLERCPIAHPLVAPGVLGRTWPGTGEVAVAVSTATGEQVVLVDGAPQGRGRLTERAAGRDWRVTGAGFWQVHPGAADVLVEAVRAALRPAPGEHLLDLYAGVGLFAGALATDLGPGGRVDAVESDEAAVRDARRNLHDLPAIRLAHERVDRWLRAGSVPACDLVVLDPPRTGAGKVVVTALVERQPRAIAYVACDPASLARDVGIFAALGYRLSGLRAFDLFPMTHHVECVALLTPAPDIS